MKFPGYWVYTRRKRVYLERATFDDTELDPATNWRQAWQNRDPSSESKGYVEWEAAIREAAALLGRAEGRSPTTSELRGALRYKPRWRYGKFSVRSLGQLAGEVSG